ncbi:dethiobiotin synthase [Singulisphaera sp. PoT]|uniref:dethiobiotin synthase n=1 Tax=Singulisphaera sp. PoT TaxID=3411797 RepID=UPI003BF52B21
MSRLPGLFVVGTDTGVGKTVISAAIARVMTQEGRRVGVLKPAATGAVRVGDGWKSDDADRLIEAIGGGVALERVVPRIYKEPLAPSVAARRQGTPLLWDDLAQAVDESLVWWAERAEVMVVEGVGGFLTPMADRASIADLAIRLDYPLVIVARKGLGTLNHTLLTVEAALSRGLRIAAVVLNGSEPPQGTVAEATNAEELARLLEGTGPLVTVEYSVDQSLIPIAAVCMNWYDRASRPRGENVVG